MTNHAKILLKRHFGGSANRCSRETATPRKTIAYWLLIGYIPTRSRAHFIARCVAAGKTVTDRDCGKEPRKGKGKANGRS